jgi:hypothetical protein
VAMDAASRALVLCGLTLIRGIWGISLSYST